MDIFTIPKTVAEIFSLGVGIVALKRGSVNYSGFIALVVICTTFILLDHIAPLAVLFYMFASSSALTKYKSEKKKEFERVVSKTGPRDFLQALCNLGIASLTLLIFHFTAADFLLAAFLGSVAAANADSWASEIGGLSKATPVMITTFRPVPKGISGGVTWTGTTGGVAGSFFIILSGGLTLYLTGKYPIGIPLLTASFLAGICGFVLDSYIGAFGQALYRYRGSNELTEKSHNTDLVKGSSWINNDVVNFITTCAAAVVSAILFELIR